MIGAIGRRLRVADIGRSRALGALARCVLLLAVALLSAAAPAIAAVHLGKSEALRAAFPDADDVEAKHLFLTDEQTERIESLSSSKLDSKLVTVHIGRKAGKILGYAFLETHTVRTQPETLLIVLSPEGKVERLLVAAFYEPPEYEATQRWLDQFDGQSLGPDLRVDRAIHGIAGATLTARAVTTAVRRALATFDVAVRGGKE